MGLILDIGCGGNKHAGSVGVDRRRIVGVDVVRDFETEMPFPNGSVSVVYLHHIVEHIHDLVAFMEELYRNCIRGQSFILGRPIMPRGKRLSVPRMYGTLPKRRSNISITPITMD